MESKDELRIEDFDIAVINLDRRTDRMSHLYNTSPIMFRRFPAIDGQHLLETLLSIRRFVRHGPKSSARVG